MDDMKVLETVNMLYTAPESMKAGLLKSISRYEHEHHLRVKEVSPGIQKILLNHTGWTCEEREVLHGCLFYSEGEVRAG